MRDRIIPIIMAANDRYAPYLGVAIKSIIDHVNVDNEYLIHVLQQDISTTHKNKILNLTPKNVKIDFIDIKEIIRNWQIPTVEHLSQETSYRLLVDKLFYQYDKVLYIDCDVIVRRDLADLYYTDIGDCILGASLGRLVRGLCDYICNELNLNSTKYFNAGVLLINVARFKEEHIGDKGVKLLENGRYVCQDQDVLNILCEGKVFYIDGRWNVEWQHLTGLGGDVVIDEARKGTLDYVNNPYVIHYTSSIKPWMRPDIMLAEYFWEKARQTAFYEEIMYQNLETNDIFSLYTVPWGMLEAHCKVILYGYGNVGRKFYSQILKTKFAKLIAVCDKRAEDINGLNVPVIHPRELVKYDFDYILIAVEQKIIADAIRAELEAQGIDSTVIRWGSPFAS